MAKKKKRKPKGTKERESFLLKVGADYAKKGVAKATPFELAFKKLLDKLGVHYIFQQVFVCESLDLFIVDFYLPNYGLIFEIDGWQHYTKEGMVYDRQRTKKLNKLGLKVLRVPNHTVKEYAPEHIKEILDNHAIQH